MIRTKLAVLAGGVGAAKFIRGLAKVYDLRTVAVIGNTADDVILHGLYISPDVDTLLYTLSGQSDPDRGWGVREDSFSALGALADLGEETWFRLGDKDLATHIIRTKLRAEGWTATAVTQFLADRFHVAARILPMTDHAVHTEVLTPVGWLPFQEFFVKHKCRPEIRDVAFRGIERARPTRQVIHAIRNAETVLICPSNPIASIGPILALPRVRAAIRKPGRFTAAISPIVGGKALKGPADRMLQAMGFSADPMGVAKAYEGVIDGLVIDRRDADWERPLRESGCEVLVTDTIMHSPEDAARLAGVTLDWMKTFHDQHRRTRQKPVRC